MWVQAAASAWTSGCLAPIGCTPHSFLCYVTLTEETACSRSEESPIVFWFYIHQQQDLTIHICFLMFICLKDWFQRRSATLSRSFFKRAWKPLLSKIFQASGLYSDTDRRETERTHSKALWVGMRFMLHQMNTHLLLLPPGEMMDLYESQASGPAHCCC